MDEDIKRIVNHYDIEKVIERYLTENLKIDTQAYICGNSIECHISLLLNGKIISHSKKTLNSTMSIY